MENGQNGRSKELLEILRLINLEFPLGDKICDPDTDVTYGKYHRPPVNGDPEEELLLKIEGSRVGISIGDSPRNGLPRFLMPIPLPQHEALYHFRKYLDALKKGQDYVIP